MTGPIDSPLLFDRWYVAGFASELGNAPLGRTFLGHPVAMFRSAEGVAALQDRCSHKHLPLSCGTVEAGGLRCGYHGLLYGRDGACREVPGQAHVPPQARVRTYPLVEQDRLLWIWIGATPESVPAAPAPRYPWHDADGFAHGMGSVHYDAPYSLVHDNLLDLSHLGYVHRQTIGGDPRTHMAAEMRVAQEAEVVHVRRLMRASQPPATYAAAWPFAGMVDRWQEIDFHISHLCIWSGAVDANTASLDDPARGGFHMRGFHGVTPEAGETTHYFWSIAANRHPERDDTTALVVEQTRATFDEDKVVIEAQFRNMRRFAGAPSVGIHVDAAPARARRIMQRLVAANGSAVL